jgi:protein kinase A
MEIIHRDIKPENLVLDKRGYVRVTDFGISRPIIIQNGKDTSGTPGYMAPEVLLRRNHSYSVDFYSLGVIAFEFMTGKV